MHLLGMNNTYNKKKCMLMYIGFPFIFATRLALRIDLSRGVDQVCKLV